MKSFYFLLALLPGAALGVPAAQGGRRSDTQCTCPPPTCPQEEPAGCECRNKAILDCSDQKQAAGLVCPVPALAGCPKQPNSEKPAPPAPRKEKPPPAVKPNPNFKCPCEEIYCVQSYPESCVCANRHARECYDNCGGPEPVYDDRCGFGNDVPPPRRDPNPNPPGQPQPDPFNTPGPVMPPNPLPPVENNPPAPPPPPPVCDTIAHHDERKQCKEAAKQRKEEEKAQRRREKEERKRKEEKEEKKEDVACGDDPPCKAGEKCVDIIFDKVGGGSETRKECSPDKESEG